MYCPKCGTELPVDAAFCRNCGISITDNKNLNGKSESKSLIGTLILILLAVLLIGAIIYGVLNTSEFGNTQTTNANVFRFLCQKNNEKPYFCIPAFSNKVYTYHDGIVDTAYTSNRIIVSIFDADEKLILETKENFTEYVFTSIDKKTGIEEDLLSFNNGQSAYILDVYKGKIYYNLLPDSGITPSIVDYKTYAFNIETGEDQYLLDGGCYISKQGMYYSAKDSELSGGLWFIKFSQIGKAQGDKIYSAYREEANTDYITPVFVDNGYTYAYWSQGGWPSSDFMSFYRIKGNSNIEGLGKGSNLNTINGKIFFIQDGALYSINSYNIEQKSLVIQNVIPDEAETALIGLALVDLALFKDPQDANKIVIATMGVLSNRVYFWDENGELLTKYEMQN